MTDTFKYKGKYYMNQIMCPNCEKSILDQGECYSCEREYYYELTKEEYDAIMSEEVDDD